jgi:hypothetical protein
MRTILQPLLAALLCLSLIACATLSERESTARLTVQYATLKVLGSDTERAERVRELVAEGKQYVGSDTSVTVAFLADQARARINWGSLDLADQLLIGAVLDEAQHELEKRIGEGLLSDDQRLQLMMVLDWIDTAALMVR